MAHGPQTGDARPRTSRLGLLALFPALLFGLTAAAFHARALPLELRRAWIPSLGIDLAFRLDGLAVLFVLLITGVGAFVLLYAAGYMAGAPRRLRLYVLLFGFMAAMLGCVTADDFFLLFVFWELTSVTSFLLVGFEHESEASRKSAQQALMITAGGGLALLVGLLLLAQAAGTSSFQTLLRTAPAWQDDPLVTPALLCVFAGAFTKSAQFPFHFWLPGAMAAPTPVSAYLHSATMVKLGVYLLARLHPAFDEHLVWQLSLVGAGAFTSVWAMVLTIRERDLKRILAWSTVAALGTLVMLIGLPGEGAATATAVFVIAHALYKAPLFFVAGNVDQAAGTRVIDEVSGLGRRMPFTAVAACLAGLSMAGIPLSFGFVAKDIIKIAKGDLEIFQWVSYAGVFVSAASVAAAAVATVRVFRLGREVRPPEAREVSPACWIPPLAMAGLGILLGLFPGLLHGLVCAAASATGPASSMAEMRATLDDSARVWALVIVFGLGAALYAVWDRLHRAQEGVRLPAVLRAAAWYQGFLAAIPWLASRLTRRVQGGRLQTYTLLLLVTCVFGLGATLLLLGRPEWPRSWALSGGTVTLAAGGAVLALVGASVAVCRVRDSFVLLLVSGVVGLASAVLFLFLGAPDVAFTQVTVEVAFVVVLAAILLRLRRLDLAMPPRPRPWGRALRALLAMGTGALVAGLVLLADAFTPDPALERFFGERSLLSAHGHNVVNVILVDFRALDTLGEILVVTVTFLAAAPLLRALRAGSTRAAGPGASPAPGAASPAPEVATSVPPRGMSGQSLILQVAVRGLYPLLVLGALVILLRGHNQPGGGFIAGMVAVAATALYAVARGSRAALARLPFGPTRLAALSVIVSLVSGLPALLAGKPYMTHLLAQLPLAVTTLDVSTVMLFDLGVFGAVWGALGGLCARAIGLDEEPAAEARP